MRKMDLQKIEDLKVWTPIAQDLSKRVDEIRARKRKPYHLTFNSRIVNEIYDFYVQGGHGVCCDHAYHSKVIKEMVEPLRGLSVIDNLACIDFDRMDTFLFEDSMDCLPGSNTQVGDYVRMHILSHICGEQSIIHTFHTGKNRKDYTNYVPLGC